MKNGFIKVGCASPSLKVANASYNTKIIISYIQNALDMGIRILAFPELALSGYTCEDLFYHDTLLKAVENGISEIANYTLDKNIIVFVGLPFSVFGKIYNTVAVINNGKLLALIPKTYLPDYNEFSEKRQFSPAEDFNMSVSYCKQTVPFGKDILLCPSCLPLLKIAVEIGADLWAMNSPSVSHAMSGANMIVNPTACAELVGKTEFRKKLVSTQSAKLICAYLFSNAGAEESTSDMVYSGHSLIAENGKILTESQLFSPSLICSEIDVKLLNAERIKCADFIHPNPSYLIVNAELSFEQTLLTRTYPRLPFIPDNQEKAERFELILSLQAHALKKRLVHTHSSGAVVGISGGLDSALSLLVCARAKELLPDEIKAKFAIFGITMPCYGTTDRTLKNARKLTAELKADCIKIPIRTSINHHFIDIKHPKGVFDITYENAQARERTQVLMDFANSKNALVVGTGDLSEIALGWATYNGDHMSMYNVNSSIPKTLVKHLVAYEAKRLGSVAEKTLLDILDTPISPELLPSDGKKVVQATEDKVGPYELHDFFLFYFARYSFSPEKIYIIALKTFEGIYSKETIKKWLTVFIRRFFTQQFKRACSPEGVKVGTVCLSSSTDWKMPSDVDCAEWLKSIDNLT